MKEKIIAGLLAVCLLLAAAGCSDSSGANPDDSGSSASPSSVSDDTPAGSETPSPSDQEPGGGQDEAPDIDPETMDLIKYNIYVEMNNYMVEILENIYSYYAVVEYAEEFALIPDTGLTYKYGISPLDSSIVDDALAVAEMDPKYEGLDELALQIAEPMRALMDGFSDIYSCYDFADNQYARAKELHVPIQTYSAAFEELAFSFMDEIDAMSDARVREQEQKMLDEGRLIIYNASHAITLVQQILDECYAQGVYDDNIIELDLTDIRPMYDELTATVAAYEEAAGDTNQLMLESLASSPMYSMNSLLQAVEWMINQVDSQTPISDPGREYLGGIIHIEVVLSDCIDQYNSAFAE